jgi:exopolysaccharide biosynthesis protein
VLLDTFVIPKNLTKVTTQLEATADNSTTADNSESGTANAEENQNSAGDNNQAASESENNTTATGTQESSSESGENGTYTENSYSDDNMSITITKSREYDTDIYLVDVVLSDISQLKTALAENTYGRNIKQTTSEIADDNNAILAINGDYYGFRNNGYVIRNGVLYREDSNDAEDLAIMSDGSFKIVEENTTSASSLLEDGALQVLSFGPALINNSTIAVDENSEVAKAMTSNLRTAVGMISPLHYVFIVSDGRTDESAGLTLYQLAEQFQKAGCSVAYNLDGGGSSTLWFNGEVINNPTDGKSTGEREVSDIVYIGY